MNKGWDSPEWSGAEPLEIACFRPESSSHKPRTFVRLLYNAEGISGIFLVEDKYVRCIHTQYMAPVYKDSCVEVFVQPKPDRGYFNFEFNCGGAMLCSHIADPARVRGGFRDFAEIPKEDGRRVRIDHSMPKIIEPEIIEPATWFLKFYIPFGLLETYVGPIGSVSGQKWRANFYKCGDETSHPHWASWMPLPEKNFHLPQCFGTILFQ